MTRFQSIILGTVLIMVLAIIFTVFTGACFQTYYGLDVMSEMPIDNILKVCMLVETFIIVLCLFTYIGSEFYYYFRKPSK